VAFFFSVLKITCTFQILNPFGINPFNLFDFSFFFLLKPVRNHKLEKADILEMTVKHLRNLQKQKLASNLKNEFI
jgi:hypothetical protein